MLAMPGIEGQKTERVESVLQFLITQPREVAVSVIKTIDQIFLTLVKETSTQKLNSIEKDLREFLTNKYSNVALKTLEKILKTLMKSNERFSEIDRDKLVQELDSELQKLSKQNATKKKIASLVGLAYLLSRRGSVERLGLAQYEPSIVDVKIKKYLIDSQLIWLGLRFEEHMSKKIKAIILNSILKKKLTKKQAVPILRNKVAKLFSIEKTESYFDVLAAAVIEQSRNFAMLRSLKDAGEEEYILWNPMDERTSEICKLMHGQTFKVDAALGLIDRIVKAETPEKVKTIAPWLRFEEVLDRAGISTPRKKLTSKMKDRLTAAGVILPPFHGRCRTRIKRVTV